MTAASLISKPLIRDGDLSCTTRRRASAAAATVADTTLAAPLCNVIGLLIVNCWGFFLKTFGGTEAGAAASWKFSLAHSSKQVYPYFFVSKELNFNWFLPV